LFIRQQTSVINAIRAHLAEFGIVAPVGRNGVEQLLGLHTHPMPQLLCSWSADNVHRNPLLLPAPAFWGAVVPKLAGFIADDPATCGAVLRQALG